MTWRFGAVSAGLALIRQHAPDVAVVDLSDRHRSRDRASARSPQQASVDRRFSRSDGAGRLSRGSRHVAKLQGNRDRRRRRRALQHVHHAGRGARVSAALSRRGGAHSRARKRLSTRRAFPALAPEPVREPLVPGAITLLHSGVVYPSERDPTQFFMAIAQMADAGDVRPGELVVRFRAAGHDDLLRSLAQRVRHRSLHRALAAHPVSRRA